MFVHGAWASKLAFNYLISELEKKLSWGRKLNYQYFEYDCQTQSDDTILHNVTEACQQLAKTGKTVVVGHSLGGILALHVSKIPNVDAVVSIASPLGGIDGVNIFAQAYLAQKTPIIKSIVPGGKLIRGLRDVDYSSFKWHHIVADRGYSMAMPDTRTDGVVSFTSQTSWTIEPNLVSYLSANHSEILQHPELPVLVNDLIH